MRVLQTGSDRSARGNLNPQGTAIKRQIEYGKRFGALELVSFSLARDGWKAYQPSPEVNVYATNSCSKLFYGLDALRIAKQLPRPDVVSAQDPFEAGLVAWLIAKRRNAPLHVQIHTDFLSPAYKRRSFLNRIRATLAGFVLKRAARVRVVSRRIKESIDRKYHLSAPISVLPIFIDVERFRDAKPAELPFLERAYARKVLLVSREGAEKNIELAIRAFKEAAPSDACLIVMGEFSARTIAEAASDDVYFMGAADPAGVYKSVDLVLVPSHYEGYGLVIVEALAAGKPVLSTDVGIAREAGAMVSSEQNFAKDLAAWFERGPRVGELKAYPYKDLDQYVRAYCDDVMAAAQARR